MINKFRVAVALLFGCGVLLGGCAYKQHTADGRFYDQMSKGESAIDGCLNAGLTSPGQADLVRSQIKEIKQRVVYEEAKYRQYLRNNQQRFESFSASAKANACDLATIDQFSIKLENDLRQLRHDASWFTAEAMFGSAYNHSSSAWDEITNQYGHRVWVCRDIKNGRFEDFSECRGQQKIDNWPSS